MARWVCACSVQMKFLKHFSTHSWMNLQIQNPHIWEGDYLLLSVVPCKLRSNQVTVHTNALQSGQAMGSVCLWGPHRLKVQINWGQSSGNPPQGAQQRIWEGSFKRQLLMAHGNQKRNWNCKLILGNISTCTRKRWAMFPKFNRLWHFISWQCNTEIWIPEFPRRILYWASSSFLSK